MLVGLVNFQLCDFAWRFFWLSHGVFLFCSWAGQKSELVRPAMVRARKEMFAVTLMQIWRLSMAGNASPPPPPTDGISFLTYILFKGKWTQRHFSWGILHKGRAIRSGCENAFHRSTTAAGRLGNVDSSWCNIGRHVSELRYRHFCCVVNRGCQEREALGRCSRRC